ncbi:hypothetical protein LOTGIDRAFT_237425 [Lottia gigantea]|uniref:glucan endo-1,3-beta-D-glucosidase n=1 Tax=Lottia gigantea TaxID=225164 RepID=V4CPG2_LOTGI|nr:hypothetical protein LOTGIDRAFT_237425 [Lottia gigantea]ESP04325.1 hypothetical protein LOTGIDRAFT_237425 [Lottia gigantea]
MAVTMKTRSMIYKYFFFFVICWVNVEAALPHLNDCVHLDEHPLDSTDPISIFGANNEISGHAKPVRVGNLRQSRPLPTGHFVTNQIKGTPVPMRLFPFEANMDKGGVTYDAYTMDRWNDPKRTDFMEQQSAWKAGEPWNRLDSLGTNMKQMVAGPDGNPLGVFTGKSGVRIGITGSGEPTLTDFGDLYANFMFHGSTGTMEVPVVRGAPLPTHIIKNANPVVKPYCLSSINGQKVNFDCPGEPSAADGGSGFLSGECHSDNLHITLHNTRPIPDVTKVQWAARSEPTWSQRGMTTCDSNHCHLSSDRKTVSITIPHASGSMAFALNYIGHYVIPWAWGDHPQIAQCGGSGKRSDIEKRSPEEISLNAKCDHQRNLEIRVDVGGNNIPGINKIQYAVETTSNWKSMPAMHQCTNSACTRHGSEITIKTKVSSDVVRVAINVIGFTTLPRSRWFEDAYTVHCGGASVNSGKTGNTHNTHTQSPHSGSTHKPNIVHNLAASKKFVMELNEPGTDLPHQTRKFVLYFSESVQGSVDQSNGIITFSHSGKPYSGLVQLGYLGAGPRGDKSHYDFLDAHAGIYSYKPYVSFCVSESRNKGYMSFDWNAKDSSGREAMNKKLLMVAMPHHVLLLQKHHAKELKNTMYGFKGFEGNDWSMELDLQPASMEPDSGAINRIKHSSHDLKDIKDAIARDAANVNLNAVCPHSDSYNVGKALGLVSRLASISRAFGTNHFHQLDSSLKSCLEKWLRIHDTLENKWKFHYDNVWGGLFLRATDGDLGYGTDYGFPYYNDHHFHLGYFLYAISYYVKHYKSWGLANKARIYSLARDVGNPSNKDKRFPVARHKDIYTGFSWATGIVPNDRQEESASESINCYHGLASLGEAFGDKNMKHTGQILLATEILSVREYWQVRQHNRQHFPPILQQFGVVGQIAENAWYVYTLDWACDPNKFPMRHGCLVGIQVIPITAVSKYWVDQEWAKSIKQTCDWAINPSSAPKYKQTDPSDMKQLAVGWKAFCYAAVAPLDSNHRQKAVEYLRDKKPQDLVGGTGSASTLLFILGST